MKWKYKNNTAQIIVYRGYVWKPGDEISTQYEIPASLGLTCTQEGTSPSPVLYHDDIVMRANETFEIALETPTISHNVALTILCMSNDGGVECRFNNGKPIPTDIRGFKHVLSWELCSRIILHNPTDNNVHISVTALEVVN